MAFGQSRQVVVRVIWWRSNFVDMYYAAQDPIALASEKREPPKAVLLPVTEETPQFRTMLINNVVAYGAQKGISSGGCPKWLFAILPCRTWSCRQNMVWT